MSVPSEIELGGLAALGAIGSVCAILLRSTHQNLKTLDIMRRDAAAASERLRQELRHNDNTIFKLQSMCADYRYTIAKLEAELLHRASSGYGSQAKQTQTSQDQNSHRAAGEGRQTSSTPTASPSGGEPQPFSLAPDGAKEKDQASRLQDQIKKKGPADS